MVCAAGLPNLACCVPPVMHVARFVSALRIEITMIDFFSLRVFCHSVQTSPWFWLRDNMFHKLKTVWSPCFAQFLPVRCVFGWVVLNGMPSFFLRWSLQKKSLIPMWMSTPLWLTCPSFQKPNSSLVPLWGPNLIPKRPVLMDQVNPDLLVLAALFAVFSFVFVWKSHCEVKAHGYCSVLYRYWAHR